MVCRNYSHYPDIIKILVEAREKLLESQNVFKYKLILENEEGTARYVEFKLTKENKNLGNPRAYKYLTKATELKIFEGFIEAIKKEREQFTMS